MDPLMIFQNTQHDKKNDKYNSNIKHLNMKRNQQESKDLLRLPKEA